MKKILGLVCAAAVAVSCAFAFTGCGSAEVEYKISEDGTYYILSGVSGNTSALKECVIASSYDDGEHGELPVTQIGDDAFMGCSSLSEVSIPDSITHIGTRAFAYTRIREIDLPESLTYIGPAAFGACKTLQSIVIPSSVTTIGPNAFAFCSALKSATVNAQITTLYYSTFEGVFAQTEVDVYSSSVLSTVSLPASLEKIDISALRYNPIEDIYFAGTIEQWEAIKFIYYTSQPSEEDENEQEVVEVALSKDEVASYIDNYLFSASVTVHCSDGSLEYIDGEVTKSHD